jgi:hypothetical protein
MLNPISVCLISFWMTILRTMLNLKLQPLCEKGLIQTLILLRVTFMIVIRSLWYRVFAKENNLVDARR